MKRSAICFGGGVEVCSVAALIRFTPEVKRAFDALAVDDRARESGLEVARLLTEEGLGCVMIFGPSHSGKTQAAMVARAMLDPEGTASFHTSAAILNTNATAKISDRSATWQTWTEVAGANFETPPALVIIDEAGSSACPSQPFDFPMMRSKGLLSKLMEAGTKFIVIGHEGGPGNLSKWAEWLAGEGGAYGVLAAGQGTASISVRRTSIADPGAAGEDAHQRGTNAVAKKNELGAEGRGRLHKPPGNAAFFRGSTWSKDQEE